jgi:arylsulfatase
METTADAPSAFEIRTPVERAASAEVKFRINGDEAATGKVHCTAPVAFTGSETSDVGMDTSSPVADGYLDKAPCKFEGTLKRLYFKNLQTEGGAIPVVPDD